MMAPCVRLTALSWMRESLLCNFTSTPLLALGRVAAVRRVFQALIQHSHTRLVIGLDADLSNRTLRCMLMLVGSPLHITLHINHHPGLRRTVLTYEYANWMAKLQGDIEAGHRVMVASLSLSVVNCLLPMLEGRPHAVYTSHNSIVNVDVASESADQTVAGDNLVAQWAAAQVVVFTPTVTVGIDFNIPNHFKSIYAYGCPGSATPRVLLQMCGRCRHPEDQIVHAFLPPANPAYHQGTRLALADVGSMLQSGHRQALGLLPPHHFQQHREVLERGAFAVARADWLEVLYVFNSLEIARARLDFAKEFCLSATSKGYAVVRSLTDFRSSRQRSLLVEAMSRALSGESVLEEPHSIRRICGLPEDGRQQANVLVLSQTEIIESIRLSALPTHIVAALVAAGAFPTTFPDAVRQLCPQSTAAFHFHSSRRPRARELRRRQYFHSVYFQ
jgi:hypothetical protein